jgi:Baseplate J-like protein
MPMPAPILSSAGLTISDYNTDLTALQNDYFAIYGSDAQLNANDIDGQLLAIFAQAYFDVTQVLQTLYNSFSPLTAQGPFLDNIVALNGITRQEATFSTAPVTIYGTAGIVITNGIIGDNLGLGTTWNLPSSVTIGGTGSITSIATCSIAGNIAALSGTLTNILTPTAGWNSVTNTSDATIGLAVELDSQLVQAQQLSLAGSSETFMQSIISAVQKISGISSLFYDNNTSNATDNNGVPGHSFALIIGGTATSVNIGTAIALSKPPGIGTFGNTSYLYVDSNGVPETINWYTVVPVELQIVITILPLSNYVSTTKIAIQEAVVNFINSFTPSQASYISQLTTIAGLGATGPGLTYKIISVTQALYGHGQATNDLIANIYQQFYVNLNDVSVID